MISYDVNWRYSIYNIYVYVSVHISSDLNFRRITFISVEQQHQLDFYAAPVQRVPIRTSSLIRHTFTYHAWQFVIFAIFTFTVFHHISSSLTCSFFHSELHNWLFGKSFFRSPFFLSFHGPFNVFILLNDWICLHGVLD